MELFRLAREATPLFFCVVALGQSSNANWTPVDRRFQAFS